MTISLHAIRCAGPDDCTCQPVVVDKMADQPGPHWVCPDCGLPCTCSDEVAGVMLHRPCGVGG